MGSRSGPRLPPPLRAPSLGECGVNCHRRPRPCSSVGASFLRPVCSDISRSFASREPEGSVPLLRPAESALREAPPHERVPQSLSRSLLTTGRWLFPPRRFWGTEEPHPTALPAAALPRRRQRKGGAGGLPERRVPPPAAPVRRRHVVLPGRGSSDAPRRLPPTPVRPSVRLPAACAASRGAFYSSSDPLPGGGVLAALTLPCECDDK